MQNEKMKSQLHSLYFTHIMGAGGHYFTDIIHIIHFIPDLTPGSKITVLGLDFFLECARDENSRPYIQKQYRVEGEVYDWTCVEPISDALFEGIKPLIENKAAKVTYHQNINLPYVEFTNTRLLLEESYLT